MLIGICFVRERRLDAIDVEGFQLCSDRRMTLLLLPVAKNYRQLENVLFLKFSGFNNLEGLKRLYNIDIVLFSSILSSFIKNVNELRNVVPNSRHDYCMENCKP
jgi:hypothetical protein